MPRHVHHIMSARQCIMVMMPLGYYLDYDYD